MNPFRGRHRLSPSDKAQYLADRARWPILSHWQVYLYFIVVADAVKIGVSGSPANRRTDLRKATWHEPEIVVALPGPSRVVETAVHKELAEAALAREWFALSHPRVQRAIELAKLCNDSEQLLRLLRGERRDSVAATAMGEQGSVVPTCS